MRVLVPLFVRLLSTLLALGLVAVGVVAIVEIVSAWLGTGWVILPDDTADRLARTEWDEQVSVLVFGGLGLVGLLAVAGSLWRRPPLTVSLDSEDDIVVERYSLERSLRRQLEALDGVTGARVRVTGRRLFARVACNRALPPDDIETAATDVLASVVSRYRLPLRPQLNVRYRGGQL